MARLTDADAARPNMSRATPATSATAVSGKASDDATTTMTAPDHTFSFFGLGGGDSGNLPAARRAASRRGKQRAVALIFA